MLLMFGVLGTNKALFTFLFHCVSPLNATVINSYVKLNQSKMFFYLKPNQSKNVFLSDGKALGPPLNATVINSCETEPK
jgi:hypothetical protein